ncbi:MAG: DEAD/DEAH box helicase [Bacteroidota bacterium]|nr:DEAD/DEAH box helicase [Bacteroidota bacterium]
MTFEELNISTPILNALNDLEYYFPTPIQEQTFPVVMSGKDVVGIAQTGTGKTLAYLLPILRQLKYSEQRDPRILIVVPTRELVLQVVREIEKLTKYMTIRVVGVYGGTNIKTQGQLVYNGVDVLVATPGRLVDLTMHGLLRLKSVQKLVIDEVDEMLNLGFRPQLLSFMEILPQRRQNLMFSATLTAEVEKVIEDFFLNPIKIEIAAHGTPLEQIIQMGYEVPNFTTKANLLQHLLVTDDELSKVLVFVSSKKSADRLIDRIGHKFPDQIGIIHSNKSQNYRINALKQFQEGMHRVLIATDVAARGLDFTDVTHVINFDIPEVPGDYIHRIGRTGRADKAGVAISFVNEPEKSLQLEIEQLMNLHITMEPLPEEVEISGLFSEEEKPNLFDKSYLPKVKHTVSNGAFHEKKDKNKKINLGGPSKRPAKIGKRKKFRSGNY